MSWASSRVLRSTVSSASAVFDGSMVPLRSTRIHPSMAVNGVRSSWESTERKSSLARLAASASERAFRSS